MSDEKIVGEFHYATGGGEWGSWNVYRTDGTWVMGCATDVDAKPLVESLDASARHFIQAERERIAHSLMDLVAEHRYGCHKLAEVIEVFAGSIDPALNPAVPPDPTDGLAANQIVLRVTRAQAVAAEMSHRTHPDERTVEQYHLACEFFNRLAAALSNPTNGENA